MKELIEKFTDNPSLAELISRLIVFAVEIFVAYAVWRLCKAGIKNYKERNKQSARADTISGIAGSTARYLIYFFASVAALQTLFGINLMSVLAAAGVVGIAVAFGAQSIVEDVLTGFFIIFEGKFEVGDLVKINDFTGNVESITLRCTTLRNYMGDVYIISNGSIGTVLNYQKGGRSLSMDVQIAYESDIDTAIAVLKDCCKKAEEELSEINGSPEVLGVVALAESGVKIRVLLPCVVGGQFALEREMLRRIKYAFDENGIEIPYNKVVIVNKD